MTDEHPEVVQQNGDLEPGVAALVNAKMLEASPAWGRVLEPIDERGWTGWSEVHPADQA